MTFTLAFSKLTYDYIGDYVGVAVEAVAQIPFAILGDASHPGDAIPACFMPCEEIEVVSLLTEVA